MNQSVFFLPINKYWSILKNNDSKEVIFIFSYAKKGDYNQY